MEIKEAKAIILAGLAGANWTTEQKEAMKTAIQSMDKIETYKKEIIELRGKHIYPVLHVMRIVKVGLWRVNLVGMIGR